MPQESIYPYCSLQAEEIDLAHTKIIITMVLLGLVLGGCGAKPKISQRDQTVQLGPKSVHSQKEIKAAESFLVDVYQLKSHLSGHTNTRGLFNDQATQLVIKGQKLVKSGAVKAGLAQYLKAQKLSPDEDHLLLIAASRHLLYKKDHTSQTCREALMSWQSYLTQCSRCQQISRYRNQAIINANSLGKVCGAWTLWESDPSRAKLSIDDQSIGKTPIEMWMPAGNHTYALTRANLTESGEIEIKVGEQKQIRPRLVENNKIEPFMIGARLKCMRPMAKKQEHEKCTQSMVSKDLFTVEIVSDREVFIYLFSKSNKDLSLIYPTNKRQGILKADQPIILPQQNAWALDHKSQHDELWMIASGLPIEIFNVGSDEKKTWQTQVEEIAKHGSVLGDQDQISLKSSHGIAFLRWILRQPLQVSLRLTR